MLKMMVMAAAIVASGLVAAQSAAPASAPSSAAKKELVAKLLQVLKPAVEGLATQLTQQPAMQLQQGAGAALQKVAPERREAVTRDIEADFRKYAEETVPLVRDRANKLAPTTIGPLLEERFTVEELRQILALLESPVNRKFQQAMPEMQRALGEKLVAESRDEVQVKLRTLQTSVTQHLGVDTSGGSAAVPAAKPAASAAKKK